MDGLVLNRKKGSTERFVHAGQGSIIEARCGPRTQGRRLQHAVSLSTHHVLFFSCLFQAHRSVIGPFSHLSLCICLSRQYTTAVYSYLLSFFFGHGMFAVKKAFVVVRFILVRISEAGSCLLLDSSIPHPSPLASFCYHKESVNATG